VRQSKEDGGNLISGWKSHSGRSVGFSGESHVPWDFGQLVLWSNFNREMIIHDVRWEKGREFQEGVGTFLE
jgi:hypothetical protein